MSMGRRRSALMVVSAVLAFVISGSSQARLGQPASRERAQYLPPTKSTYLKVAAETDAALRRDVLNVWFPRTVDNVNGGFHANFTREWQPVPETGKFSVFQGRMTWIAAQVVMRRPDLKDRFLPVVRHGVGYLGNTMWDKQYGGFYWGLDNHGQISPSYTDGKHLYGIGFCLYGIAAAYQATHDPQQLKLAQDTFRWIDQHAHDQKNGGYFESLTREGRVVQATTRNGKVELDQVSGFPVGFKSMNTHIHLMESFSQLYEVWKDDTLRQRLEELRDIVRDQISVEPGVMNLYFTNDWRALPYHDSYGHDVETAYLLWEAEEVLGKGHDPRTERMSRMLVDHALAYGWDDTHGGFYGEGTTTGEPEVRSKEWWVEMEGLNALLLMHEKHGAETARYFRAFQAQWDYIKNHQTDSEFNGFYRLVGPDLKPEAHGSKASNWKAAYHDGRALLNVSERLRRLAGQDD